MSGTELELPQTLQLEDAASIPTDPPATKPLDPRGEAMARIAAHYEEHLAEELALGDEMAREADDRAAAAEGDSEGHRAAPPPYARQQTPREAPAPAEPPQAQHHQPQLRAVNVQGQQLLVTEEQFERLASIGAVANLAMEQQHRQQTQAPPQHIPAPTSGGVHLDRDRAADIVQRLTYGSPEDGAAALQELVGAVRVDQQAIAAHATQQTLAHMQLQSDLNAIGQEFPEIFGSQDRSLLAAIKLTQVRQRDAAVGQQRIPLDQYREACALTRNGLGLAPQGRSGGGSLAPERLDREARKRAAPRNPVGVSRAANLGETERSYPTNSQVVEQMRRGRGQFA